MEEWCNSDLHTLSMKVADRTEWRQMVKHNIRSAPTGIELIWTYDEVEANDRKQLRT